MAMKDFGKVLKTDHPVGWVTVGVAVLLTVPSVRNFIRKTTVQTAVGVMAISDRVKQWAQQPEESKQSAGNREYLDDTVESAQTHEWHEQNVKQQPFVRKAVVGGLATALNATDGVIEGTKDFFTRKVRFAGANRTQTVEIGQIGQIDDDSPNRLPDHLMPQSHDARAVKHSHGGQMPPDFAVKNADALVQFANDMKQVGAGFKPEYERMVDLVQKESNQTNDDDLGTYH